jgi:S-formylglutathione hydrolase
LGAGFYVDATQDPWSRHYRMYGYVTRELPEVVKSLGGLADRQGIFGHSMGGHGALMCALRNPGQYRSVSAFAPIAAPMRCPWGVKAFSGYLGEDRGQWRAHDASELMRAQTEAPFPDGILIDQGLADKFLAEQLHPEAFEAACEAVGQPLTLRRHAGYDHGYYFIASFVDDHLRHHARALQR